MKKIYNAWNKFDDFLIKIINHNLKNPFFDSFMPIFTNLAGPVFLSVSVLLGFIFIKDQKYRDFLYRIITGLVPTIIVVHLIKLIFRRARPYNLLEGLETYGIYLRDYSFPSGHTAAAFSLFITALLFSKNLTIPFFIFAIMIAFSRIYLGVHFPTDVAGGMIVGIIITLLSHKYLGTYFLSFLHNIK